VTTLSSGSDAPRTISPASLFELHASGQPVELIDVRTPAEYRAVHATIARSEPLESLDAAAVASARTSKDQLLYVICKSGQRGQKACAAFAAAGYGNLVVNVEGGTDAWAAAGLPVVKGRSTLPLEGQVRIVAGTIVLLGCVLGAIATPWFYLLSAFGGLGLIVAGFTGMCPMGMFIAKMPWNR